MSWNGINQDQQPQAQAQPPCVEEVVQPQDQPEPQPLPIQQLQPLLHSLTLPHPLPVQKEVPHLLSPKLMMGISSPFPLSLYHYHQFLTIIRV